MKPSLPQRLRFLYRTMAESHVLLFAALWLGSAWFFYNLSFGLADRMRGDAALYFWVAEKSGSLWEAATYMELKPPGFPALVYLLRGLAEVFGFTSRLHVANFISVFLYLFHLAASAGFFLAARRLAREAGLRLPLFLLALLLVHPGLISYTSVVLTDTFAADLLMLAVALMVSARWARPRGRILLGALAGAILGYAATIRMAYSAPAATVLALFVLVSLWKGWRERRRERDEGMPAPGRAGSWRGLLLTSVAAILGGSLVLLPEMLLCRSVYGEICVYQPAGIQGTASRSLIDGWDSPRHYWSRYGSGPGGMARVIDPFLRRSWAEPCPILEEEWHRGIVRCFARRPHVGAVYLAKKSLALFDHYYLQPYAVDLTHRWVRIVSRLFGALAYAGFLVALVLLVDGLAASRGPPELLLLLAPALAVVGYHSFGHIEPRYGFGAIPGAYLALAWLWSRRLEMGRRARILIGIGLAAAMAAFLLQTSAWDALDGALRQIEGW